MRAMFVVIFGLIINVSVFAANESQDYCRESAVRFVEAVMGLQELVVSETVLNLEDANEKNVSLLSVDKKTGDNTYRVIYSSINHEVGIIIEGEWKLVADVTTTLNPNENGICIVSASNIKTSFPEKDK